MNTSSGYHLIIFQNNDKSLSQCTNKVALIGLLLLISFDWRICCCTTTARVHWQLSHQPDEDTRTYRLIKINKILIKINDILHRPPLNLHGTGGRGLLSWPCLCPGWQFFSNKYPWWIVGLYTTPHSIFMAPAVGGIAHGTVNAHPWAERPWTAHRWRWWPWLAVPRMTNYFVKNCHSGLLGNTWNKMSSWKPNTLIVHLLSASFGLASLEYVCST